MTISTSIPSRAEIYAQVEKQGSARFLDLTRHFALKKKQAEAFERRLDAMVNDRQLKYLKTGEAYRVRNKLRVARGVVTPKNTMSVDGDELELPVRLKHGILPGDKVCATLGGDGEPLSLDIEDRDIEIVGVFHAPSGLNPINKTNKAGDRAGGIEYIHINKAPAKVKDGDMVVAKLATPDHRRAIPQGRIVRVLQKRAGSDTETADTETEVVLIQAGVPMSWPKKVTTAAARVDHDRARDCVERKDLTKHAFATIDGATARDFDDAIYCEARDKGWTLWVAIADVAAYTRPGDALDNEAMTRGNSVYMPRKVVPMLPENLSNDACSLKPEVPRLVLVCEMNIKANGEIGAHKFYAATIRSRARLTYSKVSEFFTKKKLRADGDVKKSLRAGHDLFKKLLQKRAARGALEIETPEATVVFDAQSNGRVETIAEVKRNDAHRMIEEFMICANVSAAKYLHDCKYRFLSRVHSGYKEDAFDELRSFLADRGVRLLANTSVALANAMNKLKTPEERFIAERVLLGLIARAEYSPVAAGHFGLALKHYAHFTSPIRRYPDLLVHRAIHHSLKSKAGAQYSMEQLRTIGAQCVLTEKRADNVSRDMQNYYECQFIAQHIGERYSGRVVGVQSFGLFVRLDKFPIEGMVHVTALPNDYYDYDSAHWRLKGRTSGRSYTIGTKMEIEVARVDPNERHIDFVLPNVTPRTRGSRPGRASRSGRPARNGRGRRGGRRS